MPRNNAASSADPLADHKRYEKSKNLNAGAFGFVQLAKDKLNKGAYVAVKFIPRGEHINEYVEAEIINHRQLLHPHIIQFQEVRVCPVSDDSKLSRAPLFMGRHAHTTRSRRACTRV